MTDQKVVIFDIDDVLMPWAEVVHKACVEAGLAKLDSTWTQWHMWKDYGCTQDEWLHIVDSLVVPDGVYHGQPYPGVREALVKLHNSGAQIDFVTARGFFAHSEEIRGWTMEWVDKHFGDLLWTKKHLWFAQDKGVIAEIIGATHAIDDRFDNFLNLEVAGVDVYLQDQPHNRHANVGDRRVANVPEFVDRILNGNS